MSKLSTERGLVAVIGCGVVTILLLMPFHAFLTVWLSQFVGHYTLLRLWKEIVLLLLVAVATGVVLLRPSILKQAARTKLAWVMLVFGLVQLVWGVVALVLHQVSLKALGYGWIVDTRLILFFLVTWIGGLTGLRLERRWVKILFVPASVVVLIGLLQYFVLPYDVLKHFGYGSATIFPYEDINHNIHYIRVMSTLRGANPLGAYLVLVLAAFVVATLSWFRGGKQNYSAKAFAVRGGFTLASLIVLVLTFSRGAWAGLLASAACIGVMAARKRPSRTAIVAMAIVVVSVVGSLLIGLKTNATLQNVFLHTEDHSSIAATSNQGHLSALQSGLHDMLHEPLGRGPGTAGPASVYNTGHGVRIAENYFIQIAQETGLVGLGLFVAITGMVGYELWRRRRHVLAAGLLAGLVGLCVVNLFSHAWADDTLAYVWWGLAGLAIALPTTTRRMVDGRPSDDLA